MWEKEMATHSGTLAWQIPWIEKPGADYSPWGHKELDMTERLHFHSMWVVHWGLLLRLPWRTWVCPSEGQVQSGTAAWITRVLAAPGTQESWQLGQQEIQCSKRVWQPVLTSILAWRVPPL